MSSLNQISLQRPACASGPSAGIAPVSSSGSRAHCVGLPCWGQVHLTGTFMGVKESCGGTQALRTEMFWAGSWKLFWKQFCSRPHNSPRRQGKWVSGRCEQWLLKCQQGRFSLGRVSEVRIMCILWALYSCFCKERSSHMSNILKDFNKLFARKKVILNNYVFSMAHEYININDYMITKILGLTQQVWFMALCKTLSR